MNQNRTKIGLKIWEKRDKNGSKRTKKGPKVAKMDQNLTKIGLQSDKKGQKRGLNGTKIGPKRGQNGPKLD